MEAHTDRYTPTGRKHALDDFVYRILVRRTSAPNVILQIIRCQYPPYGGKYG
jgi:hypothetical protein